MRFVCPLILDFENLGKLCGSGKLEKGESRIKRSGFVDPWKSYNMAGLDLQENALY